MCNHNSYAHAKDVFVHTCVYVGRQSYVDEMVLAENTIMSLDFANWHAIIM